jgi:DNA-directed RNA polymerase II subunit RPB3
MSHEMIQTSDTEFDFIANIDASMANALRRTIINGLRSIVIDTVTIKENDSNLCDEMIVQRLGLIPLKKTDKDDPTTEYKIKLEEVGPKRVYSRDIVFPPGIEPVSPNTIILNLGPGEWIKLTGVTEEGNAFDKEHAKFSVSCGTAYEKLSDNSFHMHVETTGTISAKDALLKAIQVLKDELVMYKKLI